MSKDWTGGNKGFYTTNHRKKEEEVEENDFYATHPDSVKLFLNAAKETNLILPNNMWENACGDGAISKVLKDNGYTVFSTDVVDRGYGEESGLDFLINKKYDNKFDCIITNPPYKCFSIDTECYTKSGWKKYDEILYTDEVLSVNPETLELEWSKINDIIVKDNTDIMYHFKKSHLDIMCTKDHRMFAFNNGKLSKRNNDLILSQNIRGTHYIPRLGYKWHGDDLKFFSLPAIFGKEYAQDVYKKEIKINIEDWLRFFGFWLADGYCRHTKNINGNYRKTVGIKQHINTAEKVRNILDKLPFSYHEYLDDANKDSYKINFEIHNEQLWSYLKQFGKSHEKFIPSFIKELNVNLLQTFLTSYFEGDGSITKSGVQLYETCSKKLIEDLQEILLKLGYLSHITFNKYKTGILYHIWKNIKSNYTKYYFPSNKNDKCKIPYNEKVWCLNLEKNGVFLLRRNGKEFFSGNCAMSFVERSIEAVKNNGLVVMFMKLTFLESAKRYSLFKQYPPKYVYVHVDRQGCGKGGGTFKNSGAAAYCWYVWQKGCTTEPIIRWIK